MFFMSIRRDVRGEGGNKMGRRGPHGCVVPNLTLIPVQQIQMNLSTRKSGAKVQNINKKTHKHPKNFDFTAKVRTFAPEIKRQSVALRKIKN